MVPDQIRTAAKGRIPEVGGRSAGPELRVEVSAPALSWFPPPSHAIEVQFAHQVQGAPSPLFDCLIWLKSEGVTDQTTGELIYCPAPLHRKIRQTWLTVQEIDGHRRFSVIASHGFCPADAPVTEYGR